MARAAEASVSGDVSFAPALQRIGGHWARRWWRFGDGALGFWAAVRDVWPATTPQRDWCHKMANVLDKLPKRLRPRAKRATPPLAEPADHSHPGPTPD